MEYDLPKIDAEFSMWFGRYEVIEPEPKEKVPRFTQETGKHYQVTVGICPAIGCGKTVVTDYVDQSTPQNIIDMTNAWLARPDNDIEIGRQVRFPKYLQLNRMEPEGGAAGDILHMDRIMMGVRRTNSPGDITRHGHVMINAQG